MKIIPAFLVFLLFSLSSYSQTVDWSAPLQDNLKMPYLRILGSGENGFYILRSNLSLEHTREKSGFKSRKYILQYFTDNLSLRWEKELETSYDNGHIADVRIVNDRVAVSGYYQDKPSGRYRYYVQYMGEDGNWAGSAVLLGEFPAKPDDVNRPGLVLQHDHSKFGFVYRETGGGTGQKYHISVFDTALSPVYSKEISVDGGTEEFFPVAYTLTNKSGFFLLGARYLTDKRKKEPGESFYELYGYNASGNEFVRAEIRRDDKFLTDISLSADNANRQIVVAGFYSERSSNSTAGIFYYALDEDSLKETRIISTPFPASYLMKFSGEKKDVRNRELMNFSIDRLILRRDGGAALIAESYNETTRSYWDYYMQTFITHYYYHFGSVMVLSVNPDGNILWSNVISKDQNSADDGGYYSSYFQAVTNGRIVALYNKYIDEISSVLLTMIDGQGNQKTDVLFPESDRVTIIARSGRQIDEETILMPAYRQNKFHIAKITF